jgi:hypothetical protein
LRNSAWDKNGILHGFWFADPNLHSVCQCRLVDVGTTSFESLANSQKELYMHITSFKHCFISIFWFLITIIKQHWEE